MWSRPEQLSGSGLGPAAGGRWEPSPCSPSARLQARGSFQTSFRSTCAQTCRHSDAHAAYPGGAFWFT